MFATSTAGHARYTVTLLRSFIADGNGEGRVSRLVEIGGAKGFYSKGRDANNGSVCFSVPKQLITRLDIEFRKGKAVWKICCQLECARTTYVYLKNCDLSL